MERKLRRYIGNLGAAALISLGAALTAEATSPAQAEPSLSERFYELLDETRAEYGLPSLPRSPTLEMVAWQRASHIAGGGEFSHYDENGNMIISSLLPLDEERTNLRRAEILGRVTPAVRQAPKIMMDNFQASCRHRSLILWSGAEEIGIATAIANDGTLIMAGVLIGNSAPSKCP